MMDVKGDSMIRYILITAIIALSGCASIVHEQPMSAAHASIAQVPEISTTHTVRVRKNPAQVNVQRTKKSSNSINKFLNVESARIAKCIKSDKSGGDGSKWKYINGQYVRRVLIKNPCWMGVVGDFAAEKHTGNHRIDKFIDASEKWSRDCYYEGLNSCMRGSYIYKLKVLRSKIAQ